MGVRDFVQTTPAGWILRQVPDAEGWFLRVTMTGRETNGELAEDSQ
jgi:hypothetical protein